jgi:hypothetical protein
LFRFELATLKQSENWLFEKAAFLTFYARFGNSRRYPEYNPTRFALSSDDKILMAGCYGCCTVDWVTGKQMRAFVRGQPADDD